MPDAAVHVGSGKVRELYALDDDRLLLVASDRISTPCATTAARPSAVAWRCSP
jgi:phosphoribosylaminoimidazole-succinocarboxamide synthase